MMKLGIINNAINPGSYDYVKSLGLEFIESCCNFDNDSKSFIENVGLIKENIARTGIKIQSVGRWNLLPNAGGKFNEEQMALQIALMDSAIEIGAPVFVCGVNKDDSVSLFKNYSFAVEYFGKLLEHAAGRIKVASYNCDWNNFVCSDEQWKIVHSELPELGIKFDCSHAINRGEDYLTELSNWGDRVYHFHVKGTAKTNGRYVDDPPAGMDGTCWGNVFAILYARGYDGGLSIEPHSTTWSDKTGLGEKGIEFTKNFIRQYIV